MTDQPHLDVLVTFDVMYDVQLRLARRSDLTALEWFGAFTHYRALFARTFEQQLQNRRLMLLAVVNEFPVGQIFIHLTDAGVLEAERQFRGYVYALRVLDPFQGQGIGSRLILQAEELLRERGYRWAVIAVAKTNGDARRLYERLGYIVHGDDPGRWSYVDHKGRIQRVEEPSWMLQKRL